MPPWPRLPPVTRHLLVELGTDHVIAFFTVNPCPFFSGTLSTLDIIGARALAQEIWFPSGEIASGKMLEIIILQDVTVARFLTG